MSTLSPVPKKNDKVWFYANDQIREKTEYEARVVDVHSIDESIYVHIQKYDEFLEDVVPEVLRYLWIDQTTEYFWILNKETDYILELVIPGLCPFNTFAARDVDGGWHTFETRISKQFGILDVTGEIHKELHDVDTRETEDLPPGPEYF